MNTCKTCAFAFFGDSLYGTGTCTKFGSERNPWNGIKPLLYEDTPACELHTPWRKAVKVEHPPPPREWIEMTKDLPRTPPHPPMRGCYDRWVCYVHGEYDGWLAKWDEFYEEHKDCHLIPPTMPPAEA